MKSQETTLACDARCPLEAETLQSTSDFRPSKGTRSSKCRRLLVVLGEEAWCQRVFLEGFLRLPVKSIFIHQSICLLLSLKTLVAFFFCFVLFCSPCVFLAARRWREGLLQLCWLQPFQLLPPARGSAPLMCGGALLAAALRLAAAFSPLALGQEGTTLLGSQGADLGDRGFSTAALWGPRGR